MLTVYLVLEYESESEAFRNDTSMRKRCNISPDAVMKEVKIGLRRTGGSGDYLAFCMQMTWFCMAM